VIVDPRARFSETTLAEVAAHAEEHPKTEVCGLIVLRDGEELVFRTENNHPLPHGAHARIPGEAFVEAEAEGTIAAMYHSHVLDPPDPSPGDIHASERLEMPFLIYSLGWKGFRCYKPDGFVTPLIGRPFVKGEMDCWSLVSDYYAQILGVEMPEQPREESWTEGAVEEVAADIGFVVAHPKTIRSHDILLIDMPELRFPHFAVFLPNGQLLHHVDRRISGRVLYGSRYRAGTRAIFRHNSQVRSTDAVQDAGHAARHSG
jgi:proteasome lid subunit RPN8/RPN11